jgi:hypothetical protein
MSTFKKISLLFVALFFVASTTFGQANKGWDGTKPEVWKGSKSWQFTYTPFQSDLGQVFAGEADGIRMGGVGFRYFVSNDWSLTFGVGFGTSSSTTNDTTKLSATNFGGSVDFDYHMRSMYSVAPYIGLNVNVGSRSSTDDRTAAPGAVFQRKFSTLTFGAGVNVGFDWYFTPGMSLGGKYTLAFNTTGSPETTVTPYANGGAGTSVITKGPSSTNFGTGIMSVILNVHF